MVIASKFDGDDYDLLNLVVSHVGRMLCVDFDRLAQVIDRVAGHVQRDLRMMKIKNMITMMKMMLFMMIIRITLLVSISCLVSLTMGRLEGKEVMFKYEQSIMDSWLYLGFKVLTLISIMMRI